MLQLADQHSKWNLDLTSKEICSSQKSFLNLSNFHCSIFIFAALILIVWTISCFSLTQKRMFSNGLLKSLSLCRLEFTYKQKHCRFIKCLLWCVFVSCSSQDRFPCPVCALRSPLTLCEPRVLHRKWARTQPGDQVIANKRSQAKRWKGTSASSLWTCPSLTLTKRHKHTSSFHIFSQFLGEWRFLHMDLLEPSSGRCSSKCCSGMIRQAEEEVFERL